MMNAKEYWLWSHFMCNLFDEEGTDCSNKCPFYETRVEFCCLTCYDKAMNIDIAIKKVEKFRDDYLHSIGNKTFLQKIEEAFDTKASNKGFIPKTCPKDFFNKEHSWIDVPPRDGKRSGAFCSSPLAEHHPYLFLNFAGKQNDVLTLAHELGHGCHHQLRVKNGELNERSRMTTEEVASVFGEMLVFQDMLKNIKDDKAKLCLIASKAGDMINTAIRQIAFHFFETRAHNERKNGEVSEDRLCQIWVEEMKEQGFNMVEVRQGAKTMSNPMKQLEADLIEKK